MAKKSEYICNTCGYKTTGFYGKCPSCGSFGTMEEVIKENTSKNLLGVKSKKDSVERLNAISKNSLKRLDSGCNEFDRVMGGGIVSDSVNIISAPPGMGKSTLLLQIANNIAIKYGPVIYVSGEESKSQIKNRADRILSSISDNLFIFNDTMIENIIEEIKKIHPVFVIIDSIQMMYSSECDGVLGGDKQSFSCVNILIGAAKGPSPFAVFLVGQMTKDDELRGSREVEHAVDGVFYLERPGTTPVRMLRASKNRFGNADEVGMFEMNSFGLEEIIDPAHYFVSKKSSPQIGGALSVIKEGTRSIVTEIEALYEQNNFSYPQRIASGLSNDQLKLLLAILDKKVGIKSNNKDVYVQICGGLKAKTPSIHLALCASITSVLLNRPVPQDTIFIGEVGLTGEVKKVADIESVVKDCERFGFKNIIIPEANLPLREKYKIKITPIKSVSDLVKNML